MIRAPCALEKMEYKADSGVIVYRSKLHASLKRNFQIMPGAKWLELLLQHVPDRGEHLVRYYGWYSNRARGMRSHSAAEENPTLAEGVPEPVDPELSRAAKAAWARLIKKVYAVDPMLWGRDAGHGGDRRGAHRRADSGNERGQGRIVYGQNKLCLAPLIS